MEDLCFLRPNFHFLTRIVVPYLKFIFGQLNRVVGSTGCWCCSVGLQMTTTLKGCLSSNVQDLNLSVQITAKCFEERRWCLRTAGGTTWAVYDDSWNWVYYGRQGPSVGCVRMQICGAVYDAGYLDLAVAYPPSYQQLLCQVLHSYFALVDCNPAKAHSKHIAKM